MVAPNSSHKHAEPHNVVGAAARVGIVVGGTFGIVAGFLIIINQILNNGTKETAGLFALLPMMAFVGLMLGYALGASVGVGLQTLAGCCGGAMDTIKQEHARAMADAPQEAEDDSHAMA